MRSGSTIATELTKAMTRSRLGPITKPSARISFETKIINFLYLVELERQHLMGLLVQL